MTTSKLYDSVWVVIVTYNGQPWISRCLSTLMAGTYPVEVTVVDNGSTDDTVRIIKTQFPQIKLIESQVNLGFGQANNVGIAWALQSGADFVFLLNQDTSVEPDTVEKLVGGFRQHPEYGILSPVHLNGKGNDLDAGFFRYACQDYSSDTIQRWLKPADSNVYASRFVNAAAWLVKASTFRDVGGFSPLFFHYAEDRDYLNRLNFHHCKLGILPAATVQHYRDDREDEKANWGYARYAKYYQTAALMQAGNINRSLTQKGLFILYWLLKDCAYLLVKGHYWAPYLYAEVVSKTLSALPKVRKHRKSVKNPSPFLFIPIEAVPGSFQQKED